MAAIVRFPADDLRLEMVALFQMAAVIGLCVWISTVNVWVAGFLGICFVSSYFPFHDDYSVVALERIFFALVWFAVVVALFNRKSAVWIINAICVIALVNIGYMCIQLAGLDPLFRPRTEGSNCVVGLMGNQNLVSAVIAFAAPGFMRPKWVLCLPVIAVGLILARTTGGLVAGLCGGLFYASFVLGKAENAYVLIGCLMFFMVYILVVDMPVFLRFHAWREAMSFFNQHWAMGSGIGHWKIVFLKYRLCGGTWWVTAHNELFQAAFELGAGVLAIFAGYFLSVYKRFTREALIPCAALVVIITNSLVNFPFHIGTTALIAVSWLAILEIYLRPNEVSHRKQLNLVEGC